MLLCVLGYEGLSALSGGILLIISPDGRLMDMQVEIMHGFFRDFLIPGIILFWPFTPMHLREALAAGGGTISDTRDENACISRLSNTAQIS